MNTDTEFFRAFAGRVRQQLAETPKGGTTMSTTTDTTPVPATFKPAPDAVCTVPWCVETGAHVEHVGRLVALPAVEAQLWRDADTAPVTVTVGDPQGDYRTITSGEELRAEAARVRASGARLDALADEFDAIREGGTVTAQAVVMIGRGGTGDFELDMWPVTGVSYDFEAVYNPGRMSLAAAESRVRDLLAERHVHVTAFLNEDTAAGLVETITSGVQPPAETAGQAAAYVPPTEYEDRVRVVCTGERGAILNAYLYTPEWQGEPDGPTRLSIYSEASSEGELDAAGATRLIADLEQLLPRLRAMRDVLAAQGGAR